MRYQDAQLHDRTFVKFVVWHLVSFYLTSSRHAPNQLLILRDHIHMYMATSQYGTGPPKNELYGEEQGMEAIPRQIAKHPEHVTTGEAMLRNCWALHM